MYITKTPYHTIAILTDLETWVDDMNEEIIQLNNWFADFVKKNRQDFLVQEPTIVKVWFTLPIKTRQELRSEMERRATACKRSGIELGPILSEMFTDAKNGIAVEPSNDKQRFKNNVAVHTESGTE